MPITSSDLLAAAFSTGHRDRHVALIPYLTAGYPTKSDTQPLLHALSVAGADIIELGVPFSDPVADGPTIQRSSQIALENGVTLEWCLDQLREFRKEHNRPVILFSYLNPILRYGWREFIRDAEDAGAQGVLITDLPVGGDDELEEAFAASSLSLIRLVAPTTDDARLEEIADRAEGFIYYIARMGGTGARSDLPVELVDGVKRLRARTRLPIAVGFGISSAAQIEAMYGVAEGVVVGSALIDAIDKGGVKAAETFIRGLR